MEPEAVRANPWLEATAPSALSSIGGLGSRSCKVAGALVLSRRCA
jgi:hypothetical protein